MKLTDNYVANGANKMTLRNDGVDTALLLIEILRHIPKGTAFTTARQIQQKLRSAGIDRDVRTIQRHLETLSGRFDIERNEQSKPYGYRWNVGAKSLGIPQLSAQESVLLKFAHAQLTPLLPGNLRDNLRGLFIHAEQVLNLGSNTKLERQWLKKVRIVPNRLPLLPPIIDSQILDTVSQALYTNHTLSLSYQNSQGNRIEKNNVMPLGLAQVGPKIYLVCQFDGYNNQRILALHRIKQVDQEDTTFTYPDEFDLARYEQEGNFGFGDGETVHVEFCIAKAEGYHLTETALSNNQTIEELEDHYRVCATVLDSVLLTQWLNGWGDKVWNINRQVVSSSNIQARQS